MIKRFSIITGCLILAIFFSSSLTNNDVRIVPTVALPVSSKVIILDAGHGSPDEGASNSDGTSEAQINLSIVLKLQKLLENSGATVILTRSDANAIYELDSKTINKKKISDIKNRVKIGNSSSADIYVSIHLNKLPQTQYSGWQTFFKKGNESSKKLATSIQNGLSTSINTINTRVPLKIDNIYIIKHVEIPTTIVECGFLSNKLEEEKLKNDDYQSQLSWGIYNGIMDYFNQ